MNPTDLPKEEVPVDIVEASNPILGNLKVSGANVNNIFTVIGFVLLVLLCWVTWQHHVDAKDADKSVITILKENNKATAEALKESTASQNRILEKMSEQQQRTVEAIREGNCLLGQPQDRRAQNAEFCKRISR